jgi:hypothetical protein
MDATKLSFLTAVLGDEGARALNKAAERYGPLESILVPRAIMAWLSITARTGYEGEIPGVPGSNLSFAKSENGLYAGLLSVNGTTYPFEDASVLHVVAGVSVALSADLSADHGVKDSDLVNLGRQVDLLAKAEFIQHAPLCKTEEPAPKPVEAAKPVPASNKNPKRKPKANKRFHFQKSQFEVSCSECGCPQIEGGKFTGCMCTADLVQYASLTKSDTGYSVEFGPEWGEDELSLLFSITGATNG